MFWLVLGLSDFEDVQQGPFYSLVKKAPMIRIFRFYFFKISGQMKDTSTLSKCSFHFIVLSFQSVRCESEHGLIKSVSQAQQHIQSPQTVFANT